MERFLYKQLLQWKDSSERKPLILEGARQVGKTWLLKHFGENEYENLVYINCDNNPTLENIFFDYEIPRIIRNLSALSNIHITPGNTLIFFDEIQEFPKALTSLKYFCEMAPEYHVVAAGSLLGLMDHKGSGFPVGKIDTLYLYPLSFMEFLVALGKTVLVDEIKGHRWEELNLLNTALTELLRQYYYVGGMPEVVLSYVMNQDLNRVREKQHQIIHDYQKDISKHAPKKDLPKVMMVYNSIPSQLAKENKKFIYGAIKKGGRAKEYENAIEWLVNAGIVYKIYRVKKIELPLKHYLDIDSFKLYINDVGLLGAMVDSPAKEVLIGNNGFSTYKGSFTEQYIVQQYYSSVTKANTSPQLYYYTNDNSTLEIDFVIQKDKVYPIEVKAEENLKSKSLSTVLKENINLKGIRFSMANYREQSQMVNVPLSLSEEYLRDIPFS